MTDPCTARPAPRLRRRPPPAGFTLVELLVVVAILALLLSLIAPTVTGMREQARRTLCQNKLRVMGQAWHMYFANYDQRIPPLHKSNQEYLGVFYYIIYMFQNGTSGYWNAGKLYEGKYIENADVYWCPSMMVSRGRASWWIPNNPHPGAPDPAKLSRMTYNTRRMRYYADKTLADGPIWLDSPTNTVPNDLYLRHNSTMSLGQALSAFSFMSDMIDDPIETLMSHPPGVNVLFFDGHVIYYKDTTPDGSILYNNGIDSAWASADLNWSYDQVWVNFDKSAGFRP